MQKPLNNSQILVNQLRADFLEARKTRNSLVSTTLQAVLAAIDNAGAVPVDSIKTTSTEIPRRELSKHDIQEILKQEISELRQAIQEVGNTNRPYISELTHKISILEKYLKTST